jgi:hypothetical protein
MRNKISQRCILPKIATIRYSKYGRICKLIVFRKYDLNNLKRKDKDIYNETINFNRKDAEEREVVGFYFSKIFDFFVKKIGVEI